MQQIFKKLFIMTILFASTTFSLIVSAGEVPYKSVTYTWNEGAFKGAQYKIDLKEKSLRWEGLAGGEKGKSAKENKVAYVKLNQNLTMVTWLESVGYTVTVIVNTKTMRVDGVASNNKEHYVLRGKVDKLVK